jgi:polysaccharide export outer membrane protein
VSSCQPSKKVHQERLYLQGIDTASVSEVTMPEPLIQKGDRLSITVFSDNPEATAIYNQVQNGGGATQAGAQEGGSGVGGYLVDINGNILFHSLGPLHIDGLTKLQLIDLLEKRLDSVLKHPYVEVRFLNKKITVLGEVFKPGVINMPDEKLNIFEAIALSGDVTTFGRKDNVLIVREENGKRTQARLNTKDASIYRSPYFNLHSGDLVYVEPIRKKPTGTDQTVIRNISLAATGVSILALIYSIFRNN